jgi:thioredoxin-related protein
MKIIISIFILLSFTQSLFAKSKLEIIQNMLSDRVKVSKVKKSYANLYAVYLESGDVVYIDIKNELLFYGSLLSLKNKKMVNLSEKDKAKWENESTNKRNKNINVEEIKKIAILEKINGGSTKNILVIFDSLTCPYCVKLNRFLKDEGYKVNAYKIYNDTRSTHNMLKSRHKIKDTKSKVVQMEYIYKKYKVVGTPQIMVIKNNKIVKRIKGANMPELKKWITK